MVGDGSPNQRHRRPGIWDALFLDAFWRRLHEPPIRQFHWCLSRWYRARINRFLRPDVDGISGAGFVGSLVTLADPRATVGAIVERDCFLGLKSYHLGSRYEASQD